VQRLQYPEGLRDLQRGVVGEHDPAGADPDPLGHVRDVPDHDLGAELAMLGRLWCSASQ
jgi:hypothetical protein